MQKLELNTDLLALLTLNKCSCLVVKRVYLLQAWVFCLSLALGNVSRVAVKSWWPCGNKFGVHGCCGVCKLKATPPSPAAVRPGKLCSAPQQGALSTKI